MRTFLAGLCILTLSVVTITGCQSSQRAAKQGQTPLQRVEEGMTPEEVRMVMGDPLRTIRDEGGIRWMVYESEPYQFRIYFQKGEVAAVPTRRYETANLDTP